MIQSRIATNASQSTRWIPLWSNTNYYITSIVPPPQYKFFKISVSKMLTRSCAYLQWDFFQSHVVVLVVWSVHSYVLETAHPTLLNVSHRSPTTFYRMLCKKNLQEFPKKVSPLANDLRLAFTTSFLIAVSRAQIPWLDKGIAVSMLGAQVTVNIFLFNSDTYFLIIDWN